MTAATTTIQLTAHSDVEDRTREAAILVMCAAVDAVAAGILLLGTPLPQQVLAAVVAHGAAVLVLSRVARARPSRRWLYIAAVLVVPFAGAAVAVAIFVTKGRGSTATWRRRKARRRLALTTAAMRHLGVALSPSDALDWGDEEQRRVALSALSHREDPEAIALLRRTTTCSDPDLALSAALVLDEIGERAERKVEPGGSS